MLVVAQPKPCKHATVETPVCPRCQKNRDKVRLWTEKNGERAAARKLAWDRAHKLRADRRKKRYARRPEAKRLKQVRERSRKSRLRGAFVTEPISIELLWMRDEGTCALCGRAVPIPGDKKHKHNKSPEAPTVDHKMPLKQGGQHVWENVQLAHAWCNSEKQDRVVSTGVVFDAEDDIPF